MENIGLTFKNFMRPLLSFGVMIAFLASFVFACKPKQPPVEEGSSGIGALESAQTSRFQDGTAATSLGEAIRRGNEKYIAMGCSNCHRVGDEGGSVGPELTHVAARMSPEEMKAFIANPKAVNPDSKMPPQEMSPEELDDLVKFLSTLN